MKKYEYKTFYMDRKHIEEPKKPHGLEVILVQRGGGIKKPLL